MRKQNSTGIEILERLQKLLQLFPESRQRIGEDLVVYATNPFFRVVGHIYLTTAETDPTAIRNLAAAILDSKSLALEQNLTLTEVLRLAQAVSQTSKKPAMRI